MSDSSKRLTKQEYIEEIILLLYRSEAPSYNIKEIAEAIGVNQVTIPKYLNLIVDKFIKERVSGSTKQYYLTEEGKAEAEKILEKRKKEHSE
jgi:predicted transcriptional regulator